MAAKYRRHIFIPSNNRSVLRVLFASILTILQVGSSSAIGQSPQWGKLTVADNSFTVLMPGKPTYRQYDDKIKGRQVHVITASAYININWTEFTVRSITADFDSEPDTMLDDLCDALIEEFNTRGVSRKEVTLATYKDES